MKLNETSPILRKLVNETFQDLGATAEDLVGMRDTILIREGNYSGRSFRAGRLFAMWMTVGNVVTFYDEEGNILRMVDVNEFANPQRRVA